MTLAVGEPAPGFAARARANPSYAFPSLAGRFVLLGVLHGAPDAARQALAAWTAHRGLFDDTRLTAVFLLGDPALFEASQDQIPGLRWMLDTDGVAAAAVGAHEPGWILFDPALRVLKTAPLAETEALFAGLAALPALDDHAGVPLHAPVLVVPRVFEPELCRRLVDHYQASGGQVSGVMRDQAGRTVGAVSASKRRRDADIPDPGLRRALLGRIARRLVPEIERALAFKATRMERYIVACYDAEDGGYFRPHRDNTALATAHRKFAVSINLNAEDFEGGDLRFPEFGGRTYRPPTGGAVVFSCSLMHEAMPVTRGVRYAFLPFLFDEAGEAQRLANLKNLSTDVIYEPLV
jgi:predicted 2-oxoglutarate/Fe(II)-dependent dioxygenase YbiX